MQQIAHSLLAIWERDKQRIAEIHANAEKYLSIDKLSPKEILEMQKTMKALHEIHENSDWPALRRSREGDLFRRNIELFHKLQDKEGNPSLGRKNPKPDII